MQWPWKRAETELDREVRYHLESLADEFQRQGMPPEEALRRARTEFGGVEQFKEQCRDERRWRWLAELSQDVSFGYRMMRKSPVVTAAAVMSLALGIGATTAIIGLMDAVLWRKLGVPHPEQLTEMVWQSKGSPVGIIGSSSGGNWPEDGLSTADFFASAALAAMRTAAGADAQIAAHLYPDDVSTSYRGTTTVAKLRPVTGNFLTMLGARPHSGRLLGPGDEDPGANLAVVVAHNYWERALHGDARIVGGALLINNRSYTIAGVLPREFTGISAGDVSDLYTTIEQSPDLLDPRSWLRRATVKPDTWYLQLLMRRAPGVANEAVQPRLQAAFRSTWEAKLEKPETAPMLRLRDAASGLGSIRRNMGSPLTLLLALVGLVLLIACANIANLLLARADSRRKEVALRISLGCGRSRLIRQFITESTMIALCGGAISLAVSYATVNFALTLMPGELRLSFALDSTALLVTLAVTLVTVLVFGVYPAWRATRVDAGPALKEGPGSTGGVHSSFAAGKAMVFAQVGLGVLLVTAAAAFTTHFRKILASEAGFERTRLLLLDLRPGQSGYQGDRLRQFYIDLERRLQTVPGVERAGLAFIRPMRGGGINENLFVPKLQKRIPASLNFVTANYLTALGVPILSGRGLSAEEVLSGAPVVVISEDAAKAIGPDALGAAVEINDRHHQVVGIAARARYSRLTQQQSVMYVPNPLSHDEITAVVRTRVSPLQVLPAVREALGELDRNLPIVKPLSMEQQIGLTLQRERLFAWLCGAFGVLALLLCMIGLYGVMSYATTRRNKEIGIRMALGASPAIVLRTVIGEGMTLVMAGLVVGAPVAYLAARKFVDYRRLAMEPLDTPVIAAAMAALGVCALLAVLSPALRAASGDPVKALREG